MSKTRTKPLSESEEVKEGSIRLGSRGKGESGRWGGRRRIGMGIGRRKHEEDVQNTRKVYDSNRQ
jgi:hypothetical protein